MPHRISLLPCAPQPRRRAILGLALASAAPVLRAQSWPAGPIRVVVPYPAGSAADAIPRAIAERLQEALAVPVFVDNRAGAAGSIGAAQVARAAGDGHTLLSHTSAIAIQPHLRPTPYRLFEDFVPVAQTTAGSYLLVAGPSFPDLPLEAFVAHLRAHPGRYSYASHGSGSGPHLAMELLKDEAGLFILHVPFRGAAPALQELLAGRVDLAFETSFAALPHVQAGRLHALAVGGPQPLEALPAVPPVAALFPGFDTDGWQGFFAPAGTPPEVVERLAAEIDAALRTPALAQRIRELGFRPVGGTPAQFATVLHGDFAKWGAVVRARRIRGD